MKFVCMHTLCMFSTIIMIIVVYVSVTVYDQWTKVTNPSLAEIQAKVAIVLRFPAIL